MINAIAVYDLYETPCDLYVKLEDEKFYSFKEYPGRILDESDLMEVKNQDKLQYAVACGGAVPFQSVRSEKVYGIKCAETHGDPWKPFRKDGESYGAAVLRFEGKPLAKYEQYSQLPLDLGRMIETLKLRKLDATLISKLGHMYAIGFTNKRGLRDCVLTFSKEKATRILNIE